MTTWLLILVPVLFTGVQMVEISATHARLAGIVAKSNMLAYSIQQSVYLTGRFGLLILLPCLGLLVDRSIALWQFELAVHAALVGAGLVSILVFQLRRWVVGYFVGVIEAYKRSSSLFGSLFQLHSPDPGPIARPQGLADLLKTNRQARSIAIKSAIVYAIYGSSVYIPFFFALLYPDYRASISHMSGIVNSFAAVILTFYVEPAISRNIDTDPDNSVSLIYALIIGRIFGVAILSHLLLRAFFAFG